MSDLFEQWMRPWESPEMRFAMTSVVMAAMIWDKDPTDEHAALLRQCLRLADLQLQNWNQARRTT